MVDIALVLRDCGLLGTTAAFLLEWAIRCRQGHTIMGKETPWEVYLMATPDERRIEERRRRTERQREKRVNERICGKCGEEAGTGLAEWRGRADRQPLLLPICNGCNARLEGDWQAMENAGFSCPLDLKRPCANCVREVPAEPQRPLRFGRRIEG